MSEEQDLDRALHPFTARELEASADVVYAVDEDWRLIYFNEAWTRFAAANGGGRDFSTRWGVGANVLDATPAPLLAFYRNLFADCLERPRYPRRPLQHTYDCSTADRFRVFTMTLFPLAGRDGVLVVNSAAVDRPHDPCRRPPYPPDDDRYRDGHGFIHQCAHCMRVQNLSAERWDWVPQWVRKIQPCTSHTLCEFCYVYYYRHRPAKEGLIARS